MAKLTDKNEEQIREWVRDEMSKTNYSPQLYVPMTYPEVATVPKEGEYWWGGHRSRLYIFDGEFMRDISIIGKDVNFFSGLFNQRKATAQEIEQELIKEAKRRGFKPGVRAKWMMSNNYKDGLKKELNDLNWTGSILTDGYGHCLYKEGVWAEIIEEHKTYEFGEKDTDSEGDFINKGMRKHFVKLTDNGIESIDNEEDRLSLNDLKIISNCYSAVSGKGSYQVKVGGFDVDMTKRYIDIGCVKNVRIGRLEEIIKKLEE